MSKMQEHKNIQTDQGQISSGLTKILLQIHNENENVIMSQKRMIRCVVGLCSMFDEVTDLELHQWYGDQTKAKERLLGMINDQLKQLKSSINGDTYYQVYDDILESYITQATQTTQTTYESDNQNDVFADDQLINM